MHILPEDAHDNHDDEDVEEARHDDGRQDAVCEQHGRAGGGGEGGRGVAAGGGQGGVIRGGGEGDDGLGGAPHQAVHGEGVGDDGGDHDHARHRDGVQDVELGEDGDVGRGLGGVEGRGQDGRHGGHPGVQLGQGEDLDGEEEVGDEEAGDDEDPGPDGEEGRHEAEADGAVGGVQQEEGRGAEV